MKRTPIIDVVAAATLLLLMLSAYAIWYRAVETRAQEATTLAEELQQRGEAGGRVALARKALEGLDADEATVHKYFITNEELVTFLESLERTGEQLGADIEVVAVQRGEGAQSTTITLALSIQGTFDVVLRTLGAIEYQPYDTRLTSVTLDTANAGVWTMAATVAIGTIPEGTLPKTVTPAAGSQTATSTP